MHEHLGHGQLVKFLALGKAKAAATKYPKAIIIAADTIVSFQGKALGKPKSKEDAIKVLRSLSGKAHYVISGAVVLDASSKKIFTTHGKNKVYFRKLSQSDILNYINTGEAMDKAGAYGFIGGGFNLVKKIEGDLTTNLGLPLGFVVDSLLKLGVKI